MFCQNGGAVTPFLWIRSFDAALGMFVDVVLKKLISGPRADNRFNLRFRVVRTSFEECYSVFRFLGRQKGGSSARWKGRMPGDRGVFVRVV